MADQFCMHRNNFELNCDWSGLEVENMVSGVIELSQNKSMVLEESEVYLLPLADNSPATKMRCVKKYYTLERRTGRS